MNSKLLLLVLLFLPVLLIAQVPPPPPPGGGGGPGGTPGYSPTPIDQFQIGLVIIAIFLIIYFYRLKKKKLPAEF